MLAIALGYALALTHYLFALQDAFSTFAEDLGIMDQTLWNTAHGQFMIQTICNPIGDLNCLGVISRFAIHFEPILALLALLYRILPGVKMLMVLQIVAVSSGVVPAYLLAVRRLRHAAWGIAFSLLYLLHPSLQSAAISVFHPEALAAPLLLWGFYCLASGRYRALLALCVVLLLCKETLALDVCMLGVYVALICRRRVTGITLIGMSLATLALALILMHVMSPLGYSPVAPRLAGMYQQPLQTLMDLIRDPQRRAYPMRLLEPLGFLPLLSPWTVAIAVPSVAINLISSDQLMSTGGYQYNADIVPILIAASIDGLAWALPVVRREMRRIWPVASRTAFTHIPARFRPAVHTYASRCSASRMHGAAALGIVMLAVVVPVTTIGTQADVSQAWMAYIRPASAWPTSSTHDARAASLIQLIPKGASVSAQSMLVPHLSERHRVYQFPSGESDATYILLDVSRGSFYPFSTSVDYLDAVEQLLHSCTVELMAAQDGYLLFQRLADQQPFGMVCPHPLPMSFYTFAYTGMSQNLLGASATFAGAVRFVGYSLNTTHIHGGQTPLVVTTYWEADTPPPLPLTIVVTLSRNGQTFLSVADSWTQHWLPPEQWTPGSIVRMQTWPIYLVDSARETMTVGVQVRYGIPDDDISLGDADASIDAADVAAAQHVSTSTLTLADDGITVQFATVSTR